MIAFTCASCGKALKVREDCAGKRGTCPHCKQVMVVPTMVAAPTLATEGLLRPGVTENRPVGAERSPALKVTAPQPEDTPATEVEKSKVDFLAPAQKPDELGRLGTYRVLKVVGAGGMGMVFQAEDLLLKRSVALKVMRPELAAMEVHRQRFLREAQATAAVEHLNIVHIHQVGEEHGVPFLAMPFLKGESLDARLSREGRLPLTDAVRIGQQTAEGLAAAHEVGLIHRDIKPGNLWLEAKTGLVKILDFGLVRVATESTRLTQSGTILGTPAYMAPEQAAALGIDHRCDLFSLGTVLYRALTGQLPFQGPDTLSVLMALTMENPKPIQELNPAVPPSLATLVMQMLAKDPAQRPASARAVADALAALKVAETQTLDRPPKAEPRPSGSGIRLRTLTLPGLLLPIRRLRIPGRTGLAIKGAAGGLVVLLLLVWLIQPGPQPARPPTSPTKDPELEKLITNSIGMKLALVPKGKSWLGGGGGQVGTKEVEVPYDFYLGVYEVTQEEWEKVAGFNPSKFKAVAEVAKEDPKWFPVENVSGEDAQEFIKRLNEMEKVAGWVYRLPTQVEWEYACRGGPMTDPFDSGFDFYLNKPTNQLLADQANFGHGEGLNRVCKVGSYQPNRLGLYDMHGNVWECCDDVVKAADGTSRRIYRGGGWDDNAETCRTVIRFDNPSSDRNSDLGLRLARVPVDKKGK